MAALESFNWVDFIIIAVILISTMISLVRGFTKEVLSLAAWIVAIWLALHFCQALAPSMPTFIAKQSVRVSVAFGLIFVGTLLVGALISYLVAHLVEKTKLTLMNRFLGIVFGAGRGVLLIALVILISSLTPVDEYHAWKDSVLIPEFDPVTSWIQGFLPEYVNKYLPQPKHRQMAKAGASAGETASDMADSADSNIGDATDYKPDDA